MTRPEDTLGWEGDEVDVAKLINVREKGFRLFVYTSPLDITQNVFYWQFPDGRKSVMFARLTDALENVSVIIGGKPAPDKTHTCPAHGEERCLSDGENDPFHLCTKEGNEIKTEWKEEKPVPDHESARELNEGL